MKEIEKMNFWFITGSQDLYGEETLLQVKENSLQVVNRLNETSLPYQIIWKPIVKSSNGIFPLFKKLIMIPCVQASFAGCILFSCKCG